MTCSMTSPNFEQSVSSATLADESALKTNESSEHFVGDETQTEVDWDGPHDPHDPLNWSTPRKVTTLCIISAMGFTT